MAQAEARISILIMIIRLWITVSANRLIWSLVYLKLIISIFNPTYLITNSINSIITPLLRLNTYFLHIELCVFNINNIQRSYYELKPQQNLCRISYEKTLFRSCQMDKWTKYSEVELSFIKFYSWHIHIEYILNKKLSYSSKLIYFAFTTAGCMFHGNIFDIYCSINGTY